MVNDLRTAAQRALEAWDETVLPKAHDGMMQERMESLRYALEQPAEPVAEVINERGEVDYISYVPTPGTPLYTTPQPARDDTALLRQALEALEDLCDEQNGPPLIRYAPAWDRAMVGANDAIAALKERLK